MNNDKLQHSHIFTCTTDTDFWDLLGQVSTLMETALISRRHGGIRWQQIGSWDLSEKVSSPIFPWKKNLSGQYFYVFLVVFIRSTSCCWSFHGHCTFIPGEEFSRPRWKRHEKTCFILFRTAKKLIIPWRSMKIDGPIDGPFVGPIVAVADCPMIIPWSNGNRHLRLKQYDAAITLLIRARKLWATIEAGRSGQGLIPIFLWNIGGTSIYQLNLGFSPGYQGFDMSSVIQKGVWKGMNRYEKVKDFAKLKPPQRTWSQAMGAMAENQWVNACESLE